MRRIFGFLVAGALAAMPVFAEAPYAFRQRLVTVHRHDRRDFSLVAAKDEFAFANGAAIRLPDAAPALVRRAAEDFQDYLVVSMGINSSVRDGRSTGMPKLEPGVSVSLDPSLGRGYSIDVGAAGVRIVAADAKMAAQAFYRLEDRMNLRRGPFLKLGAERREPIFDHRFTFSGYGNDIFPDAHLNQIAHYGFTGIEIWLGDYDVIAQGFRQDVNDLIDRAAKYGLETKLMPRNRAYIHPDDPKARQTYDDAYGRMARYYPKAGGLSFSGEACEFPSKDPRSNGGDHRHPKPEDRAKGLPYPGWFPCSDWADWAKVVGGIVTGYNPGCKFVFSTYNWGFQDEKARADLIDALPKNVTLIPTFEMFEKHVKRNGLVSPVADYSLAYPGPGKYFRTEAEQAKAAGLELWSNCNSAGLTWDFGNIPYQPAPWQWKKKWDGLKAAHYKWNLSGLRENHEYGWYPSFVSELEKEFFWTGGMDFDAHARAIAVRDFGEANADRAVAAWKAWSRAADDYVPTDENQYGPCRMGPAYPFNFFGKRLQRGWAPPADFPLTPGFRFSICHFDFSEPIDGLGTAALTLDEKAERQEIELFESQVADYRFGAETFRAIASTLPEGRRDDAVRQAALGEYLMRACQTVVNLKKGRIAWRTGDRKTVESLAKAEYDNARAALKLVDEDSRLGWLASSDYTGGRAQIEWKLRKMRETYGFLQADSLESKFANPPSAAKPHTWYHLMNGNATKEGITCDFEALAKIGIGGVQMFDAGCAIPAGSVKFNSPDWFDLLEHAAKEARRLGLEICLPNCSGWSSSGGPWNSASNAMKVVTWREMRVKGPGRPTQRLGRDPDDNGHYRDIATLAFPTPPTETVTFPGVRTTVGKDGFSFSSDRPFTARGMSFRLKYPVVNYGELPVAVEVSEDGVSFSRLESYDEFLSQHGICNWDVRYHTFPRPITARTLRVTFGKARVPCTPEDPCLGARVGLSHLKSKAFFIRNELPVVRDTFATGPDEVISCERIVDLTDRLGADGSLDWEAPPGDWTVLRFGFKCNGRRNHPASRFGVGFEVDKLSASALAYHFDQYVGRLCDRLGPLAGDVASGLNSILVDSYEVGSQNWTDGFENTFLARRGYSILPYLPVLAGHLVGSTDESERFLEDFRRVLADEFNANYPKALAAKCHERGLSLSLEPYGNGPFDNLQYGEFADVPMGEFWSHALDGRFSTDDGNARIPAFVAHVWGRRIAATESFTAAALKGLPWNSGKWLTTPFSLKAQGDRVYCRGVNRIVYHRFVHQPWPGEGRLPGMTMGLYGMHFDRTQTWWNFADEWIRYQTRCQAMLQEGSPVVDVLFYCGGAAPNQGGNPGGHHQFVSDPDLRMPPGYGWDVCAKNAFLRLRVKGGAVVSPGGTVYPLLALPPLESMGFDELRQLESLLDAGAKICSRTRPARQPGLSHSRDGAAFAAEVDRIWRKGVLAMSPADALASLGIGPDFAALGQPMEGEDGLSFAHRRSDVADWYFVAMPNRAPVAFEASFRTVGRLPEIWDAEKGTMYRAREWRVENGRTVVRLTFPVSGSAFVAFRSPAASELPPEPVFETKRTIPVTGGWLVHFPHGFVPNALAEGSEETVAFGSLTDWKDHAADGVRYFSGTARYEKSLEGLTAASGERLVLDLGEVREVARVTVNGRRYPSLWKPPFAVDFTDAVTNGMARIEVEVANLWVNRLIGDDRLCADDCEWNRDGGIVKIPDWVAKGCKSPTGRTTFTTWKHWKKTDGLVSSGLLGPVTLEVRSQKP